MISEFLCREWAARLVESGEQARRRADTLRQQLDSLEGERAPQDPAASARELEEEIQRLTERISARSGELEALQQELEELQRARLAQLAEQVTLLETRELPGRLRALGRMLGLGPDPVAASPAEIQESLDRAAPHDTLIAPLRERLRVLSTAMQRNTATQRQVDAATAACSAARERFERVIVQLSRHALSDEVAATLRAASATQLAAYQSEVLAPLTQVAATLRDNGLCEQPQDHPGRP